MNEHLPLLRPASCVSKLISQANKGGGYQELLKGNIYNQLEKSIIILFKL